jgi:hypothetical protein
LRSWQALRSAYPRTLFLDARSPQESISHFEEDVTRRSWDQSTEEPPDGMQDPDSCSAVASLDILPPTCSSETMRDNGCSFQVPLQSILGGADLRLQVAVGKCPASLLPFYSVRIAGVGADKLLAPCATDAQCAPGQTCFDIAKRITGMPDDVNPYVYFGSRFAATFDFEGAGKDAWEAQIAQHDFGSAMLTVVSPPADSHFLSRPWPEDFIGNIMGAPIVSAQRANRIRTDCRDTRNP